MPARERQLAYCATADDDFRTAGQPEPGGQEDNQDHACSDCDPLEKAEEEQIQSHKKIVRLSRRLGEITMVILASVNWIRRHSKSAVHWETIRNSPGLQPAPWRWDLCFL